MNKIRRRKVIVSFIVDSIDFFAPWMTQKKAKGRNLAKKYAYTPVLATICRVLYVPVLLGSLVLLYQVSVNNYTQHVGDGFFDYIGRRGTYANAILLLLSIFFLLPPVLFSILMLARLVRQR